MTSVGALQSPSGHARTTTFGTGWPVAASVTITRRPIITRGMIVSCASLVISALPGTVARIRTSPAITALTRPALLTVAAVEGWPCASFTSKVAASMG